jgi:hypothetical protein
VDDDGDLDLLAGNRGQLNKFYLNDGVDPEGTFNGFPNGKAITLDTDDTFSIALGDMDRDGDLDLVAGNRDQANTLYLNDGSGGFGIVVDISNDTDKTSSLALGDGDLDVLEGNHSQTNKLYLNNGNSSFVEPLDISSEENVTNALVLGDIEGDLDVLAGNYKQANKLYRLVSVMTHSERVVSSKINDTETDLLSVRLDATQTSSTASARNTDIDYYLSNNGGRQWHQHHVKSGKYFTFPDAGTDDLHWKAQLKSLSPSRTPLLSKMVITHIVDADGLVDDCDAVCIAGGGVADNDDEVDGVLDVNDASH